MRRGWMMLAGLLACGPTVGVDDDDTSASAGTGTSTTIATTLGSTASTSTTAATTVGPTTTTGGDTSTSTSTTDEGDSGNASFIIDNDGFSCLTHCSPCDVWSQDCPEGERCVPWANDGGDQWNATACRDLDPEAVPSGEPCTIAGDPHSGDDNCTISSMCWDVDADTGLGTCVPYCGGSEANPICADGTSCYIANNGVLILCLPTCDPIAPMCGDGQSCAAHDDTFFCLPAERVAETYGEPCEPGLGCGTGLYCVEPGPTPKCDGACCTTLCDLAAPSCPELDQICTPYYERGEAPPGLATLGVCLVP